MTVFVTLLFERGKLKKILVLATFLVALTGFTLVSYASGATHVQLETFQIPEVVPNTTLPNAESVRGSSGNLLRSNDSTKAIIATQKLPNGTPSSGISRMLTARYRCSGPAARSSMEPTAPPI